MNYFIADTHFNHENIIRDLKQKIGKKVIEGYKVKTNFSSCEFLIEVGNITIIANQYA